MELNCLSLERLNELHDIHQKVVTTITAATTISHGEFWGDCMIMLHENKQKLNEIDKEIIRRSKLN